jgi:hypothetical protein
LAQRDSSIWRDGEVMSNSNRLTAEEDAVLRRLHALAELGVLSEAAAEMYEDLRARDRRTTVRPVTDVVVPEPRKTRDAGPVISHR